MLSHCRQYQPCPVLIVLAVGSAAEGGLANIFPNIHHATDTADRGDQQCNALWYLDNMVSSPIGLSEFWESEPMWTCQNINSIHDQGCRYHYLDGKRSK